MSASSACQSAPDWLVTILQRELVDRGATVSQAYVFPAREVAGLPSGSNVDAFRDAWWVSARINGVGVRPELGTWITNRTAEDAPGEILSANVAADRYSRWPDAAGVTGEGRLEAEACVGPIPES